MNNDKLLLLFFYFFLREILDKTEINEIIVRCKF